MSRLRVTNCSRSTIDSVDIYVIFVPLLGNEHDLSSAQQMESQTKLRKETIEHEMSMESTRHAEAVATLEAKVTEYSESKEKTTEMIDEKRAMIEAKKDELGKIWAVSLIWWRSCSCFIVADLSLTCVVGSSSFFFAVEMQ